MKPAYSVDLNFPVEVISSTDSVVKAEHVIKIGDSALVVWPVAFGGKAYAQFRLNDGGMIRGDSALAGTRIRNTGVAQVSFFEGFPYLMSGPGEATSVLMPEKLWDRIKKTINEYKLENESANSPAT